MSVVAASQFKLVRARKLLEKAHSKRDWGELRHWDTELAECLNAVFDDDQRDVKALVNELEYVLKMYTKIIAELPDDAKTFCSKPLT